MSSDLKRKYKGVSRNESTASKKSYNRQSQQCSSSSEEERDDARQHEQQRETRAASRKQKLYPIFAEFKSTRAIKQDNVSTNTLKTNKTLIKDEKLTPRIQDNSKDSDSKKDDVSEEEESSLGNRVTKATGADCDDTTNHVSTIKWRQLNGENLNCDYYNLYTGQEADALLAECEASLEYNTGQLARVHVYGKWRDIPRKQVAHGEEGLTYSFSGTTVPARPWTPLLLRVRDRISRLTGHQFNFVLINRYKDGDDSISEHRDDETDLEFGAPIASLSLGQSRDFLFRHAKSRGKNASRAIKSITIHLEHGMLLMMNAPTNTYWYHSLPKRKNCPGVRVNMTFRKMVKSKCKPVKA